MTELRVVVFGEAGAVAIADAHNPAGRLVDTSAREVPSGAVLVAADGATPPDGITGSVIRLATEPLRPDALALCRAEPGLTLTDAQARVAAAACYGLLLDDTHADFSQADPVTLRRALPAGVLPPRLRDDCFAMPQGVDWVPVDDALARLRAALHPVATPEPCATEEATGRVLASDAMARRANPPTPNSAVDGYGFAHAALRGDGPYRLPLLEGRSAAGQPFGGAVPEGAALRILTGAPLPGGVDTVVLEEDTGIDGAAIVFDGPLRAGANTRAAGEDMDAGQVALAKGHRMRPPDVALLSALGVAEVEAYRPLRVGVLSTGDEIVRGPATPIETHQIWDANAPMLLGMITGWGHRPVNLGHVGDDADAIAARLDEAAGQVDVILASGGASAGDEDHVSRLLRERGQLAAWRIALKPGRPLALALWQGVPVFGLPGNPVAAFVCALIFARPALSLLAGAGWQEAVGFQVQAAFSKRKKPGRREFLRARLTEVGTAEVFRSEGSGRISGLAWANGLVELPDDAIDISPGDPVRFLPYAMFGLD